MSVRKILGYLEEAELIRYQRLVALAQITMSGNSNISVEEGVNHLIADWQMLDEIRKKYDILGDEAIGISLFDGAIIEDDE